MFRVVAATAFAAYALALPQTWIWYDESWSAAGRSTFDGLVYALLSAGAFGRLWP